jgi:hypothetical protein
MKKTFTKLFAACAVLTFIGACKKDAKTTTTTDTTSITVTVKDVSSWSSTNTALTSVSGATVNLYDSQAAVTANTPLYTKTTDQTGSINIPVSFKSQYFITVKSGAESNIYTGYLIMGVFQTSADLQNGVIQSGSVIGGPRFEDVNGDGVINAGDKVTADVITPKQNATVQYTSYIK